MSVKPKLPTPVEEEIEGEEEDVWTEEWLEEGSTDGARWEGAWEGDEYDDPDSPDPTFTGPTKIKDRKSRSSIDVRDARDDVINNVTVPSSPGSPPTPCPATAPPTSRRKKIWNSFRSRTRRLRGKHKDKNNSADSPADGGRDTTDEECSHPEAPRFLRRHRSDAGERPASDGYRLLTMSAANHDAGHADDVDGGGQQKRPTLPSLIDSSSGSPGTITGLSTDTFLDWKTQGSSQRAQKISADSGTLSLLGEMLGNRDGERHSGSVRGDRSADSLMSSVTVTERGSDRIFPMVRQDSLFDDGEVDSGIALVDSTSVFATVLRQRQNALMEHPFFLLEVQLKEGRDLVVRDTCGTSDPYVKFKIGGKQVYRSRTVFKNLNPKWDETFTVAVEDVHKPIQLKVFDYDRGLHDDPMGVTEIDCSELELGTATDLKLMLSERGKSDYMGYLLLTCTLIPKTQEDKDQFMRRTVRSTESARKMKIQPWLGVLTIVLVEGEDLMPMDDNGFSDPYVKFRLGNQKYRSKHKSKSLHPKWLEQFDLRLYDDQSSQLEISVYDHDVTGRDDFMGRATVDISKLETEVTHNMEVELEDGAGVLRLLMTISGTCGTEASSDLSHFTPDSSQHLEMAKKYSLIRSFSDLRDVGHLQIKVFKACGLKSMDIGGQSDPFCVLELVNARVQTHTEYKTLNPEWNKVFTFKVRDVHSILEVTVYDEDRDKKAEFLGKVAIPLLRIKTGERRWYALKDKKLMHRTKGAILLEMELFYNNVKAAIRTVNPCEDKFMQVEPKFKIQLLKRNIDRVSQLVTAIMDTARFLRSCFCWDSKPRSITAFIVFLVMVWNFELYMLPITLLIIFMKNLMIAQVLGAVKREPAEDDYFDEDDDDDDEDKDKEEKKSFKEKLQSIQDVCLQVQQAMDTIACIGERIKNTFNWTVPWLTTLAVIALVAGVFVLYFIPLRYLILAWGVNKFTKKLRSPNAVNNNELLDFLSRVPSDDELILYRELRPELTPTPGKKKRA